MTTRQATPNIFGNDPMGNMLAGRVAPPAPEFVKLAAIRRDGGMQPRAGIDAAYVSELAQAIADGAQLPPVDVTYDGTDYWLWDGYHRWQAHAELGLLDIAVTLHQGDQTGAQWQSFGTNQTHGLRRSNEDKERAIRAALRHPHAAGLSNNAIAKHLGVSDKTVERYREQMTATSEIRSQVTRTGADGRTIDTTNIGKPRTVSPAPAGNGRASKDREYYSAVDAARDKYEPAYQVDGPALPAWVEEEPSVEPETWQGEGDPALAASWSLTIDASTDPAELGQALRGVVGSEWMERLWDGFMGEA